VVARIDLDVVNSAARGSGADGAEVKTVEGAHLRGQDRRREHENTREQFAEGQAD